jgi:ribonucleoside-diphosphate reductase alpha chain
VRGIGEPVGLNGKTSGIIPFVRVMDSLTLAISQGSLRRGSAACYIDISHPEIEEFLEIRKPSGDFNRKALEPAPRRAPHRCVHGSGARRRGV